MTTVMQSSTASIAVTLSALHAGAVGLDQALALVIGQNIGTATSSAVAAIGASSTAKRLAVAYIAFKLVAALIAIVLFPFVTPLIVRASQTIDATTLLAGLPHRLQRGRRRGPPAADGSVHPSDRASSCRSEARRSRNTSIRLRFARRWSRSRRCAARSSARSKPSASRPQPDSKARPQARRSARLSMTRRWLRRRTACAPRSDFLSKSDPPPSDEGHAWFTSTVHALDHASRLAEAVDAMAKNGRCD